MTLNYCVECAKGKEGHIDCCTSTFQGNNPGFWLTLSDIARILKKTGMNPEEFCRIVDFSDDAEEDDGEHSDETYGELMCIGDKSILMNSKDGKCIFVNEKGCSIFEARTKMCRVYPFWFKEVNGKVEIDYDFDYDVEDDDCLITKKHHGCKDFKFLLSLMGETEEGFRKLAEEYIEEMKLHNKYKQQLLHKPMLQVLKDNGFLD